MSIEIAAKEVAGGIQSLARGLQEGEIGGEDVHHALPDVKFGRAAGFRHQIGVRRASSSRISSSPT
jgi:hypothetical protein